jgi:hypothetical protein
MKVYVLQSDDMTIMGVYSTVKAVYAKLGLTWTELHDARSSQDNIDLIHKKTDYGVYEHEVE